MTLTEKWKKGELESGWYYITTSFADEALREYFDGDEFRTVFTCNVKEVLAPVPSYEEWQEKEKEHELFSELCERLLCIEEKEWENIVKTKSKKQQIEFLSDKTKFSFLALFDENQRLKEDIRYGFAVDDVVMEKMDKLKAENQQLKELLKECREVIGWYKADCGYKDTPTEAVLTQIDNAIGEKK